MNAAMRSVVCGLLPFVLALNASAALAAPRGIAVSDRPPAILVLKLVDGRFAERQFEAFVTQISLTLDGFAVFAVQPETSDFSRVSLALQLTEVGATLDRYDALAAVWVEKDSKGGILVHLASLRTGQVLVRQFGVGSRRGSPRTLALAVRELLGTAYLFEPREAVAAQPAAIANVVSEVRARVAGTPEPKVETRPTIRVWGAASVAQAVTRHRGPGGRWGGSAGFALPAAMPLPGSSWVGATMLADRGPIQEDPLVRAWGLESRLELCTGFRAGSFETSPFVALGVQWRGATLQAGQGPQQDFDYWRPMGTAGVRGQWLVGAGVHLAVQAEVWASPHRQFFRRASDQTIIYSTPTSGVRGSLGLLAEFGASGPE